VKISAYQVTAVLGSALLMVSGYLRFLRLGSPKELVIGVLYFAANLFIFCL
jgi:hypothetical protein